MNYRQINPHRGEEKVFPFEEQALSFDIPGSQEDLTHEGRATEPELIIEARNRPEPEDETLKPRDAGGDESGGDEGRDNGDNDSSDKSNGDPNPNDGHKDPPPPPDGDN